MDTTKLSRCQLTCWSLSALTGILILWAAVGPLGLAGGVVVALVVGLGMALLFTRLVCTGHSAEDPGVQPRDIKELLKNVTGVTFYKAPLDEDDLQPRPAPSSAPASTRAPASTSKSEPTTKPEATVATDTLLAGEQELAERKGDWRYDGADAARPEVGTRPETLSGPRGGQADDLKQIKGVGPKLEALCHEIGVFHFDQIARWTEAEVAWVDENLTGFKGRVSRDDWVAQAKTLAAGGETEFSRRKAEDDMQ